MFKAASAALVAAALLMPSHGAPLTDWRAIAKALDGIPTAAGVSLKRRLASCHITVHRDTSWMETRAAPWPEYGAKPGDTVIKLLMDLPPAPPQAGPAGLKPNPPQTNVPAIFLIQHGKASAISSWANVLLNRPVPLGYDASNNC